LHKDFFQAQKPYHWNSTGFTKKSIADFESLEAYISREELTFDALVVDTSLLLSFPENK